ncbi:unnamed protein product, partial [Ectocarpus sp. 6 AP-2014]
DQATGNSFLGATTTCSPEAASEVDFVYGLPPGSATGGCVVQRSFEDDLRAGPGVASVNVHVASDPASAKRVFELLRRQGELEERGVGPPSRVLIIDGIALLFLRDRLHELVGGRGGPWNIVAGFIHCPFSEPFYREEPWLRVALPERMLQDESGAGIRAEERRLFGLLDKVIAVGAPCRTLLTADYGVREEAIVVVEPTFTALAPNVAVAASAPAAAAAAAAAIEAGVVPPAASVDISNERPPRFVSVGTLCPRKGQLGLIAALRAACASQPIQLGGSVLTLIGGEEADPSYAEAVRAAAAAAAATAGASDESRGGAKVEGPGRLEVRLLGPLPREETLEHVGASDAFLLNSCSESWAVAPVEAALRGVPVLSTRVGWLAQSLPAESTIWVGSGRAGRGPDSDGGGGIVAGGDGVGLASATEWGQALLRFAHARQRLRIEAERAVPGLAGRFCRAVAADTRGQAVRTLMETTTGRRCTRASCGRSDLPGGYELSNGPTDPSTTTITAVTDQERVRRATVNNALACVCATCVSISGAGGAAAGLAALVAAQCLLLVGLAPPCSPANLVTVFRSFIPPAVVWFMAGSDFGQQVSMADVTVFGVLFVLLDVADGILARRSKSGPTRVGAALDVESDSIAVLFLSLAASRKAWRGGFIAGVLRYLFVLATDARELPPSPIGPAGRWVAKIAALASVAALAASVGNGAVRNGGGGGDADTAVFEGTGGGGWWVRGGAEGSSPLLCAVGVAVLCASFSIDFFQIWVLLPREEAAAAAAAAASVVTNETVGNGSVLGGADEPPSTKAIAAVGEGGAGGEGASKNGLSNITAAIYAAEGSAPSHG